MNDENYKENDEKKDDKIKANYAQYGAKCLGLIVLLPTTRNKLFNYNTAYDSYMDFITEAKKNISIHELRKTFPHNKDFATHEMILTPSFVCFLAMTRLRKMLGLESLPSIECIVDPPMKVKTKKDKELLKKNPNDPSIFYPNSRNDIPGELQEFARSILNEIEVVENSKHQE